MTLISPYLYLKTNARNQTSHVFNDLHESFYYIPLGYHHICLLYTSDAADDMQCVYLGCRRIIKKKKYFFFSIFLFFFFFFFFFFSSRRRHIFFFKQKTAYEMLRSLVGSEMCIRDRHDSNITIFISQNKCKESNFSCIQ